jgi:membrane protein
LGQLHAVQHGPEKGLTSEALANRLKVSPLQLEEALATLSSLDWVGSLKEDDERYVLLVSPKQTPLRPLIDRLLLSPSSNTRLFSNVSGWASLSLGQVLSHVHLD